MISRQRISALPALLFALLLALRAMEPAAAAQPAMNPPEVEAWMDSFAARQMRENHIPGAIICIVKDGRIFLSKGYGWADIEKHRPVDPHATLFRIASVTKTFTATAIMQLVERGNLGLDTDVRSVVDFPLPLTSSKPLRVADLLTHRGGFENGLFGVISTQMTAMPGLKEVLSRTMPTQVRDPGTLSSYSNHGFTLLAYVIERKTGASMADYMQDNIFAPLGMQTTSFRQPLPAPFNDHVATGYSYTAGRLIPHPFEIVLAAGGGAISSTADDMGRFMLAQLELGVLDGRRILSEESARTMHDVQFSYAPGPGGMGYGFPHASINGHDVLWHTGALYYCYSRLVLIPDSGVGFFVAGNSDTADELQERFLTEFMNRYFPQTTPDAVFPANNAVSPATDAVSPATAAPPNPNDVDELSGVYRRTGAPMTTFAALVSLSDLATLQRTASGLSILRKGRSLDYRRVAAARYRTTDADAASLGDVVFFRGPNGKVAGYAVQNRETSAMERVANPLRQRSVVVGIASGVYTILTLGILAAGVLASRWRTLRSSSKIAIALVALNGLGAWVFLLLLPWLNNLVSDEMDWVPRRLTVYLSGTTALALLFAASALLTLWIAFRGTMIGATRAATLVWSAAASTGAWLIFYWHLFGYHYY